jgi:hypothetical protein
MYFVAHSKKQLGKRGGTGMVLHGTPYAYTEYSSTQKWDKKYCIVPQSTDSSLKRAASPSLDYV